MKNLLVLIFILSIFLPACKKEARNCVKADFIGEFIGTTVCNSNGAMGSEVATVILVSSGTADNELIVNVSNFNVNVIIDGCNFSGVDKNADVDLTFSGSLSGDNLTVKVEGSAFEIVLDCESKGKRN